MNSRIIEQVDRAFLNRLFDSPDYRPRGMFICEENVEGIPHEIYVAVDNRTGEATTEEFNTHYSATMWLRGRKIKNRFGELLNVREDVTE